MKRGPYARQALVDVDEFHAEVARIATRRQIMKHRIYEEGLPSYAGSGVPMSKALVFEQLILAAGPKHEGHFSCLIIFSKPCRIKSRKRKIHEVSRAGAGCLKPSNSPTNDRMNGRMNSFPLHHAASSTHDSARDDSQYQSSLPCRTFPSSEHVQCWLEE